VTGLSDDNNNTFVDDQLVGQYDDYYKYTTEKLWLDWTTTEAVRQIILYIDWALGIPGNILSAIVWLRRHVANDNPSAIYLAALAINDLLFLLSTLLCRFGCFKINCGACLSVDAWFCCVLSSSSWSTAFLETLLVISFSVVRLIAIRRPLQVGCISRLKLISSRCRKVAWQTAWVQFISTQK